MVPESAVYVRHFPGVSGAKTSNLHAPPGHRRFKFIKVEPLRRGFCYKIAVRRRIQDVDWIQAKFRSQSILMLHQIQDYVLSGPFQTTAAHLIEGCPLRKILLPLKGAHALKHRIQKASGVDTSPCIHSRCDASPCRKSVHPYIYRSTHPPTQPPSQPAVRPLARSPAPSDLPCETRLPRQMISATTRPPARARLLPAE